jgi:thiol-disulfide isomerase/thioredoxin
MGAARVLAALVLVASWPAGAAPPVHVSSPVVGKPAPDFEALTFDGKRIKLSDLRGQVVVLNFWATWCGPCKVELPILDAYDRARAAAGLRVLAVATEDSVPPNYLRPLAKAVSFPLVRRLYGPYKPITGVPTNYIIDRAGVLRYAKSGALDLDSMNELFVPLLNEPAEAPTAQPAPGPAPASAPARTSPAR